MDFATTRFAENGFHPTSVAEITEGLGVGKGVFYWYFDSKDELLRAILADAQLDLRRRQRAVLATSSTPSEGEPAPLTAARWRRRRSSWASAKIARSSSSLESKYQ